MKYENLGLIEYAKSAQSGIRRIDDWHEISVRRTESSNSECRAVSPFKRFADPANRILRKYGLELRRTGGSGGRDVSDENPFSSEAHHRSYGRPWCLGRDQIDYLLSRGLCRNHRFLDVGCGSLRSGIWVIGYLDPGNYYGIEAHPESLEAGARYEIPLHGLESKKPHLLVSSQFEVEHWAVRFDWIFAFAVMNHLTMELQELAMRKLAGALAPVGRLVISPPMEGTQKRLLERNGLVETHRQVWQSRMLPDEIHWTEVERRV